MITREEIESGRPDFDRPTLPAQLEAIARNLERIRVALADPADIDAMRAGCYQSMGYFEWTCAAAWAADDIDTMTEILDCPRLLARLTGDWEDVAASAELRRWVALDVRIWRDRVRALARRRSQVDRSDKETIGEAAVGCSGSQQEGG